MIRVAVSGAAGRMGRLTAEAVDDSSDLELTALYDPHHAGRQICGLAAAGDPTVVGEAEVVVEFTRPEVVMENLGRWLEMGVHAVVGTSGFDTTRLAEVRSSWGEGPPHCIIVPNFSIGAVLLMHFSELAARHFTAAEVIELHHADKPDAPSGTALATARGIAEAQGGKGRSFESTELAVGARGAEVEGVPVHSIRLPGVVASQEVVLGDEGQTLSLRHDTFDRASFMPGVLLAVRTIGELPGVTVGLEPLLGLE